MSKGGRYVDLVLRWKRNPVLGTERQMVVRLAGDYLNPCLKTIQINSQNRKRQKLQFSSKEAPGGKAKTSSRCCKSSEQCIVCGREDSAPLITQGQVGSIRSTS